MTDERTFHAGEQAVQKRLGVFQELRPWAAKVVRGSLPEQHRTFYGALPFLVAAARDRDGRPWATLLTGRPGFAGSPDPKHLRIRAQPVPGDALEHEIVPGVALGLLGIDLATRRRNRVNGQVVDEGPEGLEVEVGQSFGNCPQYIHEREWHWAPPAAGAPRVARSRVFTAAMRERITAADTFFIATGHPIGGDAPSHGMDASHRGGAPGFVKLDGERRLVFPDYAGNNHFNTLGNLVVDGRTGLLFVDFQSGGMLQLTGRSTIDWGSAQLAAHPGARRLVTFELDLAVELSGALPLRWTREDGAVRRLRLRARTRESEDVVSFTFEAADGAALPEFEPGQHLPLELHVPGQREAVRRTYSLTSAPGEGAYRISVKREPCGTASRFLHDHLEEGALVDARDPAGDFTLAPGNAPVALISAGIGVTPMLGMLRDLLARDASRKASFVHVARDGSHHVFAGEVRRLVAAAARVEPHVFYTQPAPGDRKGRDYDHAGRPDGEHLAALLPDGEPDVYLCGPVAFMAGVQQALEQRGIAPERIHSEDFGPRG